VIATATNTVVATVPVSAFGVAITPDGKHAYVTGGGSGGGVSVIDTTTNPPSVTATVAVPGAYGVGVTPDGNHVYVTNDAASGGTVSVIDTATNTVEAATVAVGNAPTGVGIISPPASVAQVPFLAFSAQLQLDVDAKPTKDAFALESSFTLSSSAPAINPLTQPVAFQVGPFSTTLPPGSFKKTGPLFTTRGSSME
jgi:YVTN family beta-propeller protein